MNENNAYNPRGLLLYLVCLVCILSISKYANVAADDKDLKRFYAIVVGVNDYQGKLAFTDGYTIERAVPEVAKALRFYALRKDISPESIFICILTDKTEQRQNDTCPLDEANDDTLLTPTSYNIKRFIQKLAEQANRSDDTFVFYFTGHGSHNAGDIQLYMTKSDGTFRGMRNDQYMGEDYRLPLAEIEARVFTFSFSRNRFIIIDACQNRDTGKDSSLYGISKEGLNKRIMFENNTTPENKQQLLALLLSSGKGEYSHIDERLHMGFFTKFLIKVFYGDADTNLNLTASKGEIRTYLEDEVRKHVYTRVSGAKQQPLVHSYSETPFNLYEAPPPSKTRHSKVGLVLLNQNKNDLNLRLIKGLEEKIEKLEFDDFGRFLKRFFKMHEIQTETPGSDLKSIKIRGCKQAEEEDERNKLHNDLITELGENNNMHLLFLVLLSRPPSTKSDVKELGFCIWAHDFLGNTGGKYFSKNDKFFTFDDTESIKVKLIEGIKAQLNKNHDRFRNHKIQLEKFEVVIMEDEYKSRINDNACGKFLWKLASSLDKTNYKIRNMTIDGLDSEELAEDSHCSQPPNIDMKMGVAATTDRSRQMDTIDLTALGREVRTGREIDGPPGNTPRLKTSCTDCDFVLNGRIEFLPNPGTVSVTANLFTVSSLADKGQRQLGINKSLEVTGKASLSLFVGQRGTNHKVFEEDELSVLALELANSLAYEKGERSGNTSPHIPSLDSMNSPTSNFQSNM